MNTKLQSTETLEKKLEQQILQFEEQEGLSNIIMYVEGNEHLKDFVQKYQNEIRTHQNEWPYNDSFTPTFLGLVHRFHQTSINYVLTATNLFRLLKNSSLSDLSLLYEVAILSEAARGREGKRSKVGLDYQQDILISELFTILNNVWIPEFGDMEEKLNTLVQTVLSRHSSAAELPENYAKYIELCNEVVTLSNLESIDEKSNGLARKLLREFCCYSITKFNKQLFQYREVYAKLKYKADMIANKRYEKIKLTEMIANRIESIGGQATRFLQLIEQIDYLNYLNDNIDVKYSFKSWPGLIHWNVFAKVIQYTGTEVSLSERGRILINI